MENIQGGNQFIERQQKAKEERERSILEIINGTDLKENYKFDKKINQDGKLDNNIKVGNFYNNIGAGRKSGYEVAKKLLKEMYKKDEEVQVSKLAKQLRVTYSTGRNYLLRFLEEELGVTTNLKYYNYKK